MSDESAEPNESPVEGLKKFLDLVPDSKHPLFVTAIVGIYSTLLIPVHARYGDIQEKIRERLETREEVVQCAAKTLSLLSTVKQAAPRRAEQPAGARLEEAAQAAREHITTAEFVLDAHISLRFRDPGLRRQLAEQIGLAGAALKQLEDGRASPETRAQALERYRSASTEQIRRLLSDMEDEVSPSAWSVYRYVVFGF